MDNLTIRKTMSNKKIYIIRHGETEFNKLNIVQGSGVDTDLNETGRTQAVLFYHSYKDYPFDVVYTSSLKRSQQSVEGFLAQGIKHYVMPELNEISWGDFEGKQQTAEQQATYWHMIQQWNEGNLDAKIVNGESPIEMQLRQKRALDFILAQTHEKEVLICMHGRAMKSLLCLFLNKSLTQMEDFQHSNLCLYKLLFDGTRFSIVENNNNNHLILNKSNYL